MGLSAMTDDNNGKPLGSGFVTLATSAGNALLFADPASANAYRLANPAQFSVTDGSGRQQTGQGGYNTEVGLGQS